MHSHEEDWRGFERLCADCAAKSSDQSPRQLRYVLAPFRPLALPAPFEIVRRPARCESRISRHPRAPLARSLVTIPKLGPDGLVPLLRDDWEALERIDDLMVRTPARPVAPAPTRAAASD